MGLRLMKPRFGVFSTHSVRVGGKKRLTEKTMEKAKSASAPLCASLDLAGVALREA